MASRRKHRLVRLAALADRTFVPKEWRGQEVLEGKCIHCNAKLVIRADGAPLGGATLEHIVPKTHGGTDAIENLALACARCNAEKGIRHDHKRADDPRLRSMIERLQRRKRERLRKPDERGGSSW